MKDIIVMYPTVRIATQKCEEFLNVNNTYVCGFNKAQLSVRLANGTNIYFKGETEGQRVLRGTHADIIQIDEFPMDFNENKINKKESVGINA